MSSDGLFRIMVRTLDFRPLFSGLQYAPLLYASVDRDLDQYLLYAGLNESNPDRLQKHLK
ncbi:MAG TPA: hypothetical protein VF181_04005 [Balneolaceae bacterium]